MLIEHAYDDERFISEPSLFRVPEDISETLANYLITNGEAVTIPEKRWDEFLEWYAFNTPNGNKKNQNVNILETKRGIYLHEKNDIVMAMNQECHGISVSVMQHIVALSAWENKLTTSEKKTFMKIHKNKKLQKYLREKDHPIFVKSCKHFFAECFARYYSQDSMKQTTWHYKQAQELWKNFPEVKKYFTQF